MFLILLKTLCCMTVQKIAKVFSVVKIYLAKLIPSIKNFHTF
jgi:hypothetical protein